MPAPTARNLTEPTTMPSNKFKPNDAQSGATYNARTGILTLHDGSEVNLNISDRPRSYLAACKRWDEIRAKQAESAAWRDHWRADRPAWNAYLDECDRLSKLHKRQVNDVHAYNPGWVNPCPRPAAH